MSLPDTGAFNGLRRVNRLSTLSIGVKLTEGHGGSINKPDHHPVVSLSGTVAMGGLDKVTVWG